MASSPSASPLQQVIQAKSQPMDSSAGNKYLRFRITDLQGGFIRPYACRVASPGRHQSTQLVVHSPCHSWPLSALGIHSSTHVVRAGTVVGVFAFGKAFDDCWKLDPGTLVCLADASVDNNKSVDVSWTRHAPWSGR